MNRDRLVGSIEVLPPTYIRSDIRSSRDVHMRALSQLQASSALRARPDVVYGTMIPEPDYSDEETESSKTLNGLVSRNNKANLTTSKDKVQKENREQDRFDQNGLIMPKKLINPGYGSTEKKNLHKELLFNKKLGINVLNQKTELQKAMEKHKDKKAIKEQEEEKKTQLTPLQKAIDERAQKIEKKQQKQKVEEEEDSSDFLKVQAKFRSKIETK